MAQRKRSASAITYIEPFLLQIVDKFCQKNDTSRSDYIRKLLISNMKESGLLTDSMIAEELC